MKIPDQKITFEIPDWENLLNESYFKRRTQKITFDVKMKAQVKESRKDIKKINTMLYGRRK